MTGAFLRPRSARYALAMLSAVAALLCAVDARGQASLAAEDIIDEVVVTVGSASERFTVMRDAVNRDQWYYVPDQPRLAVRSMAGDQREPEFTLVRFQAKDPADPEKLTEGGYLQFAMTLGLPPEVHPQLVQAIATRTGANAARIRLAALPFKAATAHLYIPESGALVASAPLGSGIAPTFATQKMVFAVPLSKLGSDVYDALVNGNTGVAAGVEFTFTGLTPPAGFTILVDWDQAYSFYSKDEKFRAEASVAGYFGLKASADRNKFRETLEQNKVIKVEQIGNTQDLTKHIDQILNRINTELSSAMVPPSTLPQESAAGEPSLKDALDRLRKGVFGVAGYSSVLKDRKQVKKGIERVSFMSRAHEERKTLAAGFVGIGSYPEEVRRRLVTVVPPGAWKSAFFLLPSVGDAQEIGISQVDLEIRLRKGEATHATQVAVWKPSVGWTGVGGAGPRSLVAFGLMDLYQRDSTLSDVKFETATHITLKNDVLRVNDSLPVDDQRALVTPLSAVKVVRLDATSLSWAGLAEGSRLVSATISVQAGDKSFSTLLKPRLLDKTPAAPLPVNWIVPRTTSSVVATISFRLDDGTTVNWSGNGRNLAADQSGAGDLFIELVDADWRKPGSGND